MRDGEESGTDGQTDGNEGRKTGREISDLCRNIKPSVRSQCSKGKGSILLSLSQKTEIK
jgi:hypothetical protein